MTLGDHHTPFTVDKWRYLVNRSTQRLLSLTKPWPVRCRQNNTQSVCWMAKWSLASTLAFWRRSIRFFQYSVHLNEHGFLAVFLFLFFYKISWTVRGELCAAILLPVIVLSCHSGINNMYTVGKKGEFGYCQFEFMPPTDVEVKVRFIWISVPVVWADRSATHWYWKCVNGTF